MQETELYTHTLTNKFCDEWFKDKSYSGTIESSILHLIADMFSDDELKINGTQIICDDERRERVLQARAMFFYFLNKFLGYSNYAISRKYGFHNINIGKLIHRHEYNIKNIPFIFYIHKTIWNMGDIWKINGLVSEQNIISDIDSKQKKNISKLDKKHGKKTN